MRTWPMKLVLIMRLGFFFKFFLLVSFNDDKTHRLIYEPCNAVLRFSMFHF